MEQYGEFSEIINRLESNLGETRTVWTDQTAQTYDHINENMQFFTVQIWQHYCNSVKGRDLVKANYDESEFGDELNQINSKIYSV